MRRGLGPHPGVHRPKSKGGRRFPHLADPLYLAYVRQLPCAMESVLGSLTKTEIAERGWWPCGSRPERDHIEPAHVVATKGSGQVHDRGSVVPLCPVHHDEQEGRTKSMVDKYGVDLYQLAEDVAVPYTQEFGPPKLPDELPECDDDGVVEA